MQTAGVLHLTCTDKATADDLSFDSFKIIDDEELLNSLRKIHSSCDLKLKINLGTVAYSETQTFTYNALFIEVEKGVNMFESNTYTENYIGGDSYLINIQGGLIVSFSSETFTNNGNTFKEAFDYYISDVDFIKDNLQDNFSSTSLPLAKVKSQSIVLFKIQ